MAVPCGALGLEVLVTLASDPLSSEPSASWDAPRWAVLARVRRSHGHGVRVHSIGTCRLGAFVFGLPTSARDSPPVKGLPEEGMQIKRRSF